MHRPVRIPRTRKVPGAERYGAECRGAAQSIDYLAADPCRPVCLLTIETPDGHRVFVVPPRLEALAGALAHSRSMTVVRCHGRSPTPVVASLAEATGAEVIDTGDGDAI